MIRPYYILIFQVCIKKNDKKRKQSCLHKILKNLEFDGLSNKDSHLCLSNKDVYALEDAKLTKPLDSVVRSSQYNQALEYVKNEALEHMTFMKNISEEKGRSKEQLAKILSDDSIQIGHGAMLQKQKYGGQTFQSQASEHQKQSMTLVRENQDNLLELMQELKNDITEIKKKLHIDSSNMDSSKN